MSLSGENCVLSFDGRWQLLSPSEAVYHNQWVPGRMLVYCLSNIGKSSRHFRLALLKDHDKYFCKEFVLASPHPESEINEVRLGRVVEITLKDGNCIRVDGIKPSKIQELSRLFSTITKPEAVKPWPQVFRDKVAYHDADIGGACHQGLYTLLKDGQLTDVTLVAQNEEFPCHRAVLAASSEYFRVMLCGQFVEASLDRITLSEISGPIMRLVLDYLYTGEIEIGNDNVQDIFTAAHMLQLAKVEDWCALYMKQKMSETNCIGMYFFAKSYDRTALLETAMHKICTKFAFVTKEEEFVHLDVEAACEILQIDKIQDCTEDDVYQAAVHWLEFDFDARKEHMFRVMKNVRFVDFEEGHFRTDIKDQNIFKDCQPLQNLFEQVIYYMNHPYRWHELDFMMEPRTDGRPSTQLPQAIMYTTHDSDGRTRVHLYAPDLRHRVVDPTTHKPHTGGRGAVMSRLAAATASSSKGNKLQGWDTDALSDPCIATLTAPSRDIYFTNRGSNSKGGEFGVSKELRDSRHALAGLAKTYTWNLLPSLIHSRKQLCMVAVDCFLYAIGGCHKSKLTDSVEKYGFNPSLETWGWIRVAPLPCRLRGSCGTSFRGKLYVFGGESPAKKRCRGNLSPNVFRYDPETDRWSTLSPMKEGRTLARCAIYKGKVYVIGGLNRLDDNWLKGECPVSGEVSTCELYDPVTDQWVDGPALPQPVAAPGVVKYKGTIFVLGGMQQGGPLRTVYRLNEAGDSWEVVSSALYHPEHVHTHIHSCFSTVNMSSRRGSSRQPQQAHSLALSDTDSETTCGTSMEHFDMDSSTDDEDELILYEQAPAVYAADYWRGDSDSSSSDW